MKTINLFFTFLIAATVVAVSAKPLTFFAKVNDTLMPLAGTFFTEFADMSVFSYGDPSATAAEFNLTEDNYAYAPNSKVVGFVNTLIVFGSTVNPSPLKLDSDNKLLNGRFYSCKVAAGNNVHKIFYEIKDPYHANCFEVDIYLLPYDINKDKSAMNKVVAHENQNRLDLEFCRTNLKLDDKIRVHEIYYCFSSGHGMNFISDTTSCASCSKGEIYHHFERKTKSVIESQKEKNYVSPSQKFSYVLFAKVNGTMVPLGARIYPHREHAISAMCYGPGAGDPIQFQMEGSSAISIDTPRNGYLGIYDQALVFSPDFNPTDLMLDDDRRLRNANYFSCMDSGNIQVITAVKRFFNCFEVEIYLLNADTDAVNYMNDVISTENENAFEEERQNVFKEEEVAVEQNEENNSLSVSQNWSYMLFAKIDDEMVPLGSRHYYHLGIHYSAMCYGDNSGDLVEFEMVGNSAISINTSYDGYVGIFRSMLTYSPNNTATDLMLDENRRVRNADYFSCDDIITTRRLFSACFSVSIYLLHENKEAANTMIKNFPENENTLGKKKTVLGQKVLEKGENQVSWKASLGTDKMSLGRSESSSPSVTRNLPYLFFVKYSDIMLPLGARVYIHEGIDYCVLCYGHTDIFPVKFNMEGNYAHSQMTAYDGYVGIHDRTLVFGPGVAEIDLILDENRRVCNSLYFSCWNLDGFRSINTENFHPSCFEVELYLLHEDREVTNAMIRHLPENEDASEKMNTVLFGQGRVEGLKKGENEVIWKESSGKNEVSMEKDKVSSEKNESNNASESGNLTYMLFVNDGDTMVPLGARFTTYEGQNYSVMSYGYNISEPVKFNMEGKYALSQNTSNDGYLGIYISTLVFGHTIDPTDLMLDDNRKLCNSIYYSCWAFNTFRIISTERMADYCYEVEIHLLHHDEEAAKNMIDVPAHEKENSSKKGRKKEFWEEKKSSEKSEVSSSSVTENLPYVIFVKFNHEMIPLSAEIVPHFGTDVSVMYYELGRPKPVDFILEDGQYAKSIGTPTNGYLGVCDDVFAFGPNMPRGRLLIDSTGKLTNTAFYSCWCDPVDAQVISTELINDSCFQVEIYFKHIVSGYP